MSRSRGRGPKTKSRAKPKPASPTPFMMFQIYDRLPWMEVRWAEELVPAGLDTQAMTMELVEVIRKHMAKAEIGKTTDEVRVSGVPYAVPAGRVNGHEPDPPEPQPETTGVTRPQYPY